MQGRFQVTLTEPTGKDGACCEYTTQAPYWRNC